MNGVDILRARLRGHISGSTQKADELALTCRQLVLDFLEEWSHRPLWIQIFNYIQTNFLDYPPPNVIPPSGRRSGSFLLRKMSTSESYSQRRSVGEGMIYNMDIKTMEGLRKSVNFNLVLPLFCDLVGLQLSGMT